MPVRDPATTLSEIAAAATAHLDAGLIPITIPELLRLLREIVIPPPRRDRAHRLHWPAWRWRHQAAPAKPTSTGTSTPRQHHDHKWNWTPAITPAGRQAFRAWLEQESAPPQHQSEALLRVTFAESGSKEALLASLRGLAAQAREYRDQLGDQAEEYLTTGGPFPERLHLIALVGRFLIG